MIWLRFRESYEVALESLLISRKIVRKKLSVEKCWTESIAYKMLYILRDRNQHTRKGI